MKYIINYLNSKTFFNTHADFLAKSAITFSPISLNFTSILSLYLLFKLNRLPVEFSIRNL